MPPLTSLPYLNQWYMLAASCRGAITQKKMQDNEIIISTTYAISRLLGIYKSVGDDDIGRDPPRLPRHKTIAQGDDELLAR